MSKIVLKETFLTFVIYPKGGYVADGVRFVTIPDNISGNVRPKVGDAVEIRDILHTWWRSLTIDEIKSMYGDGIMFDKVAERLDVILI